MIYLFVCIKDFTSHYKIFNSHGDVTITSEEPQILTCTQHSWPFCSEGSLTCHTCDTMHQFKMVISDDNWLSRLLPSVWQWNCHYRVLPLRYVTVWIHAKPSACEANALTDCATAAVPSSSFINGLFLYLFFSNF